MAEELLTEKTSRSKLLKRAGVGAAAVWAAPFLTSTASAGVLTHKGHCVATDDQRPICPACVPNGCGRRNNTDCFCFPGLKRGVGSGCCECTGNFFCGEVARCQSNGHCPRGWKCTNSCCGVGFCAPPCGQGISSAQIGSGLTAAG